MTNKLLKKIDDYLSYLKYHPEEVKRINDETEQLWEHLEEIEKDTYNISNKPFTI